MTHAERMQRARKFKKRHDAIAQRLDVILEWGASALKWCKHSPVHNHWSTLFAQLWFIDCPCCLFYRGVTFGIALSFTVAFVVAIGAYLIGV